MILDIIIGTTRNSLRDIGPSVTVMLVKGNEYRLFVIGPLSFFESRIQMVYKTLTTLLALSTRQMCSNLCPLSSVEFTLFSQNSVLFRSPRPFPFDNGWACQRLPLGETIDRISC